MRIHLTLKILELRPDLFHLYTFIFRLELIHIIYKNVYLIYHVIVAVHKLAYLVGSRNTLDLSAVPIIHEKTHLPVIVDPSHATGKANLVEPMMIAAVAAGADGLEVEVHYDPRHAWSDGAQCLTPDAFAQAMAKCRQVAWAIGRDM